MGTEIRITSSFEYPNLLGIKRPLVGTEIAICDTNSKSIGVLGIKRPLVGTETRFPNLHAFPEVLIRN